MKQRRYSEGRCLSFVLSSRFVSLVCFDTTGERKEKENAKREDMLVLFRTHTRTSTFSFLSANTEDIREKKKRKSSSPRNDCRENEDKIRTLLEITEEMFQAKMKIRCLGEDAKAESVSQLK